MRLEEFRTPRLLAERLQPAHWNDLRRMDEDAMYMALLGGVRDAAGTRTYLEENLAHWAAHGFGIWMLREAATGGMVGRAVLRHLYLDGRDEVEVGYGFLPAWWGRGLATEIARACVRIGLEQLALSSLVAITLPENTGSRRVMEKVGLRYEGDVEHAGRRHVLYRAGGTGAFHPPMHP